MAFPSDEELLALIAPAAGRHGLDVEALRTTRAGAKSLVDVRVDADDRPDLERLEELAEELSTLLDAAEAQGQLSFGPGYRLEVSTPGVDQPLSAPRHWRRNRGRLVALTSRENGQRSYARIGALSEEAVVLIPATAEGKPLRGAVDLEIRPLAELAATVTAVVQIEFGAAPAEQVGLSQLSFEEATNVAKG